MINTPGIKNIAPKWMERISQRLTFQVALSSAYITFARHYYPKWASYFLDEHFQAHGVAHLLAFYRENTTWPEPVELANIWAEQMMWLSEETRQRYIAELVPVASRFLRYLETELLVRPEFQPIFEGSRRRDGRIKLTRGSARRATFIS
jgi:hypothetical protein